MTENLKITINEHFVETKYPGYFWNWNDKKLYSIKSGSPKRLTPISEKSRKYVHNRCGYPKTDLLYCVSVKGQRRYLFEKYLKDLQEKNEKCSIFDVQVFPDGKQVWKLKEIKS